jgi:peroxiredoxin/uncharacterized GH25 family protein
MKWIHVAGASLVLMAGLADVLRADETNSSLCNLTGVVRDSFGKPLAGATVFIYTAAPKKGPGLICPSCYADCRKRASTDSEGHFKIESLDTNLLFRVLIASKGCRPKFIGKVDPSVIPMDVALEAPLSAVDFSQQLKGRVVNQDGKPIPGAVVKIRGVKRGESTRFGGNEDVDPLAVTDDDGLFVLNGAVKFDGAVLEVEARAFANRVLQDMATGGTVNELKLTEGASLTGRLVWDGQPIAGVTMGISGAERNAEYYVGDFSVATDKEGRFGFVNLPPNCNFLLYAKMSSLHAKGAVATQNVRTPVDGAAVDVGDVKAHAGFKLNGQVRLSDGKPVPPKTTIYLSRSEAADQAEAKPDKSGHFGFGGVPSEPIHLSVRLPGYQLSPRNKSMDWLNPYWLAGTLKSDKENLVVELDPGNSRLRPDGNYPDLSAEPLQGVEAAPTVGAIHFKGKVVDAETGKAIDVFTYCEGRTSPPFDTIKWMTQRRTEGLDGQFETHLSTGRSAPALLVEAKGYLPQASDLLASGETNFTFALKKGTGPSGVVLKPDGTPLAGAVVRMADMNNGVYVDNTSMWPRDDVYREARLTKTDEKGRFGFEASIDDYAVLILENDGFAEVKVTDLAAHPEIKLQPWSRVEGQLMIGTRAGSKETVRMELANSPYVAYPRRFSPLNIFLTTQTDGTGHFAFNRVPPVDVVVSHSPYLKGLGQGPIAESQQVYCSLKPGEVKTLALGGKGRPVTGKVVVDGSENAINLQADLQSLEFIVPPYDGEAEIQAKQGKMRDKIAAAESVTEKQRLSDEMHKVLEEANVKRREFYSSKKGRAHYFQNRRYAFNCAPDGSFRIEDVAGGNYRLRIAFREGNGGGMRLMAPEIASVVKEVEIPDAPGGRSDEPFDLGVVAAQSRKVLRAGKLAPDFAVKTIDDKTIKLSDCAGKYVLLDFWATWCGPCCAEMPNLKATYDAFKNDPRFRMISLSLDSSVTAPRAYANKNQLGWTMGFLGDWSKADLPNQYGVYSIPGIFLIGPDRKIIVAELRGNNIKAAVEKALAQRD